MNNVLYTVVGIQQIANSQILNYPILNQPNKERAFHKIDKNSVIWLK